MLPDTTVIQAGTLVPHNIEAEQAVLGALLIDPDAIYRVRDLVQPADLYLPKHRWIFDAVLALNDRQADIDFITVCDELERRPVGPNSDVDQLTEIGGAAYLTSLINATPTSTNVASFYSKAIGQ